jgi:hypothetical protein
VNSWFPFIDGVSRQSDPLGEVKGNELIIK